MSVERALTRVAMPITGQLPGACRALGMEHGLRSLLGHELFSPFPECRSLVDSPTMRHALNQTEELFHSVARLTRLGPALPTFLASWGATHNSSGSVAGLVVRLLRAAWDAGAAGAREELIQAATHLGETIGEDTGVDDTPHIELYATFAHALLGSYAWRDDARFCDPACAAFRTYVQDARTQGEISGGLLVTAASEFWNAIEYEHAQRVLDPWCAELLGCSGPSLARVMAYVTVHADGAESRHLQHAVRAWQLYSESAGRSAEPALLAGAMTEYATRVGEAYQALTRRMQPVV